MATWKEQSQKDTSRQLLCYQNKACSNFCSFPSSPAMARPAAEFGHGTHLSGIIGAKADSHNNIAGVAPNVKIMTCKFLDKWGNGQISDAARCLSYAVKVHFQPQLVCMKSSQWQMRPTCSDWFFQNASIPVHLEALQILKLEHMSWKSTMCVYRALVSGLSTSLVGQFLLHDP